MKNPTNKKIIEQLEFKLNDKRKEINLDEEMENLNKIRRKESNKRRKKYEQEHRKQIR